MITQFNQRFASPMYGMKRYIDSIDQEVMLHGSDTFKTIMVRHDENIPQYCAGLLPKYLWHFDTITHLTHEKMAWVRGMRIPTTHILNIYDTIMPEFYLYRNKYWKICEHFYDQFEYIVTISEDAKERIHRVHGIPTDRIRVIPCGVDTSAFKRSTPKVPDPEVIRLGYLGNYMPHKNMRFLSKVLDKLHESTDKRIEFLTGGYDAPIKRTVESDVCIRTMGFVDNLPKFYETLDVYVSASLMEGFGLPVLEAMAMDVPVVVSNRTSHPEVVRNAGYLVDYDVDQWVGRILQSVERPTEFQKQREAVVRSYSWENSGSKMIELYDEAYQHRGR